jgi:hypothetical protein
MMMQLQQTLGFGQEQLPVIFISNSSAKYLSMGLANSGSKTVGSACTSNKQLLTVNPLKRGLMVMVTYALQVSILLKVPW